MKKLLRFYSILFLFPILLGGSLSAQSNDQQDIGNSLLKKFNKESKLNTASPPISFMENKGQIHDQNYKPRPDVLFGAMAGNMTFHLKTNGVSLNNLFNYINLHY